MIVSKKITYKGISMKSNLEYFFYLYLEELQDYGFIDEFWYEKEAFKLSESVHEPYLKQMKSKVVREEELLLRECTYTPDFQVKWNKKAGNIFYLDRREATINRSNIIFRLGYLSNCTLMGYYEIKPMNESKLDSSKEFPTLSKWIYEKYNIFVQKIKPYDSNGKNCLFQQTFTPKKVIASEVYNRDCKWGNAGATKIKYPIITLDKFLKGYSL